MDSNCKGHTLIELLIAMTLSMLVIAALIPINTVALQSVLSVRQIENQVNRLNQSVTLLESDLKSTALTGCASGDSLVVNSLHQQQEHTIPLSAFQWLSGYSNHRWFPHQPVFSALVESAGHDALQIVTADISTQLSAAFVAASAQHVVFITNCHYSEIARAVDATLLNSAHSITGPSIHSLQFIQYYVKDIAGIKTLYRQYLSRSGTTVTEPLIDHVNQFLIGYGEISNNKTLEFKPADKVNDWKKIAAVYVKVSLSTNLNNTVSIIVPLINHAYE